MNALLIDLAGTVFEGAQPIPGAAEVISRLNQRGVAHCFVTNTTSRPRSAIVQQLHSMDLPVKAEEIYTAPSAAADYLRGQQFTRCHFLVADSLMEDFAGIEWVNEKAQAVVVGDIGKEFTFEHLNHAFRLLMDGAELVALARNRYFRGKDGLQLDAGPFIAALEYASGKQAVLTGKPSPTFFDTALKSLGSRAAETAVIGDDLEGDVLGAQQNGLKGVLVRTGKYRPEDEQRTDVHPDYILRSIAELESIFS